MFEDVLGVYKVFDKEKFIKEKVCPYCGSKKYDADYNNHEAGEWVEFIYECNSCGKEWIEKFKSSGDIRKV